MTARDAAKKIFGRRLARGVPRTLAHKLWSRRTTENLKEAEAWARAEAEAFYDEVDCWKEKCLVSEGTTLDLGLEDLMLDVEGRSVDIDLSDSFGGGSYC